MARRRRRRRSPAPLPPFFRRRSTKWLYAAIVTLAVGIVLGVIGSRVGGDGGAAITTPTEGRTPAATQPLATPSPAGALPDIQPDASRLERAEVLDIIDGDTIDVRIDGREERVRYYGIDTPERGDDCFREATDRNESLAGETVLLLPDARERDRYDRLLRYAFDAQGDSIEAQLIAEGLGLAWRQDGSYRDELIAAEDETRAAEVGCLWGG